MINFDDITVEPTDYEFTRKPRSVKAIELPPALEELVQTSYNNGTVMQVTLPEAEAREFIKLLKRCVSNYGVSVKIETNDYQDGTQILFKVRDKRSRKTVTG